MTDRVDLTTSDRLDVVLFLAISAVLAFAAVAIDSDASLQLLLALLALVPLIAAVELVRQRRSGNPRQDRFDGLTKEQKLIRIALTGLVLTPVWFLGQSAPRDWPFAVAYGAAFVSSTVLGDAVARRWPAGGLRSLLRQRAGS